MSVAAESGYPFGPLRVDLKVPHYWQLSERWGLHGEEARRICALMCLKTVLDFKSPALGDTGLPLESIIERTTANGGRTEHGWRHTAEVETLRDFGLNAWRRDWNLSGLRTEISMRREGYDVPQVEAVRSQQRVEAALAAPWEKARASIVDSLFRGDPVIASVSPGFSENGGPHQIVIHGCEEAAAGIDLLVTDPVIENTSHQEKVVSWDYFAQFFKQRAIFVSDAE